MKIKIRWKPIVIIFCIAALSFILIMNRIEMVPIGCILAGGIITCIGASAAGDYCKSRYYRPELDERNFEGGK